ncbi:hypothetical protein LVD17_07365 [Fulvivirga ulvae]|uniref:hypothetical protein n=1 Tax=Fulvivirga ulvae TaxID=2904245 RepID=UPI001F45DC0E|nr:hypothetical protein [Fulvivirga ulvae]UII33637.1 hypothetical protein LVD17_07365 [Fulvivirga ulvae]
MTKLRDVSLFSFSERPDSQKFNRGTLCVQDLYYRNLTPIKTNKIHKISIHLYDSDIDVERLNEFNVRMNKSFSLIDIIKINHYFDFDQYFNQPIEIQKRIILDLLYEDSINVCEAENWDSTNFKLAYEACLEQDLKNAFYDKEKAWNRNRSMYVNLKVIFETDILRGIVEVYRKDGSLVLEKELFAVEPMQIQHPFFAKVKWLSRNKFRVAPISFFNQLTDDEFWDIEVEE